MPPCRPSLTLPGKRLPAWRRQQRDCSRGHVLFASYSYQPAPGQLTFFAMVRWLTGKFCIRSFSFAEFVMPVTTRNLGTGQDVAVERCGQAGGRAALVGRHRLGSC